MKQFLSATDTGDIEQLIQKALDYKVNPLKDIATGTGKRIGLLFLNPSLRTRLSTQIAAKNLGMEAIVCNIDKEGWALEFTDGAVMNGNTVEHIKDAAPVLGQYFDLLCLRTFPSLKDRQDDDDEKVLTKFVQYAGVPVISLESATLHPLQSLADLITIREHCALRRKPKVVLTWAPHVKPIPQCVANSFAQWMTAWDGAVFTITHPEGFALNSRYTHGAEINTDQEAALKDADYVYVKNWSSYQDYGKVYDGPDNWLLTEDKLAVAPNARIMHCLPVRRNVELSDQLLDGPRSLVNMQAGNRVWAAQAVISEILKSKLC